MELIPTVEVGKLTDRDVRRLRLYENRISELATNNEDNIKMELIEVEDEELSEIMGLEMLGTEGDDFDLPDNDKPEIVQVTFTLHQSQKDTIENALKIAKEMGALPDELNDNKNGNALARVAELFL